MNKFAVLIIISMLFSCKSDSKKTAKEQQLQNGIYRVTIGVQNNKVLPFTMEVISPTALKIFNAEEIIDVDEIAYRNDSIFIKFPVFESYFAGVFDGNNLKGNLINKTRNRISPFSAEYQNPNRFNTALKATRDLTGIWQTAFSEGTKDEYIAKGVFKQKDGIVTGTFRTTTGDYRYLEGIMEGDSLKLSTFDGAHAFLFEAKVTDATLNGQFYSGTHWKEPFVAKRNPDFELPNSNELTFLKDGFDRLEFSFSDASGNMVSLSDKRFENKVVLVQIMGTWCPNCLDATNYYSEFYNANKAKGFEVVALTVEFVETQEKAFANIERLKERVGITYPILLAQYGSVSKTKMQEKLPMLNHVMSYPTSIFIDKTGQVRKIHTGFNGPGTGETYLAFKNEFETFVGGLLSE
jgi:thiol-disulfide isomerase/thioredoxin